LRVVYGGCWSTVFVGFFGSVAVYREKE
jgi:hypothetical protein